MSVTIDFAQARGGRGHGNRGVYFSRAELRRLLDVYSRRVASGEWRDYAIDSVGGTAIFSIFRHTFDRPLFSIVKRMDGKRCHYAVESGRQTLARGRDIDAVLKVFDKPLRLVR